tara:strand:+ start:153 stop:521 length:369 start_codon:yes stop_codon:yes gene_type:complete
MVEYISTLNHVPEQDVQPNSEFLEDDLAMFTNANFFDFDLGQDADLQPTEYNGEGRREPAVAPDAVDMKSLEFMNGKQRLFLVILYLVLGYGHCFLVLFLVLPLFCSQRSNTHGVVVVELLS